MKRVVTAVFFGILIALTTFPVQAAPGKVIDLVCRQSYTSILCQYTPVATISTSPSTDIRYRIGTVNISAANFASSSQVVNEPTPYVGTLTFVSFPSPSTGRMSFALKNCDSSGCGLMSNYSVVQYATPPPQATFTWDPNPAEENVAGYKIYYGFAPLTYTMYVDVGNNTTFTLQGLTSGTTYYFSATAYNSADPPLESDFSEEISKTF
jgi:hypothetical protein